MIQCKQTSEHLLYKHFSQYVEGNLALNIGSLYKTCVLTTFILPIIFAANIIIRILWCHVTYRYSTYTLWASTSHIAMSEFNRQVNSKPTTYLEGDIGQNVKKRNIIVTANCI